MSGRVPRFFGQPIPRNVQPGNVFNPNQVVYQRNPNPTVVYQPQQPGAPQQNYFAQQQFVHTQRQGYDYGQQQQNVIYIQSATRQQQVNQTGQAIVVVEDHAQQGEMFEAGHSAQGDDFGQQQYIQFVENPVRQSVRHVSASAGSADQGITYQILQPVVNPNPPSLDHDNYENQQQALVHVPRPEIGFITQGQHQLQQTVADSRQQHQPPPPQGQGNIGQILQPQGAAVADPRQQHQPPPPQGQGNIGQTQPPQGAPDPRQQQQPPPPQQQEGQGNIGQTLQPQGAAVADPRQQHQPPPPHGQGNIGQTQPPQGAPDSRQQQQPPPPQKQDGQGNIGQIQPPQNVSLSPIGNEVIVNTSQITPKKRKASDKDSPLFDEPQVPDEIMKIFDQLPKTPTSDTDMEVDENSESAPGSPGLELTDQEVLDFPSSALSEADKKRRKNLLQRIRQKRYISNKIAKHGEE